MDNGLENLSRREKPDSTEFPWVQPGSGLHRVHTDIKIVNNTKINHIMVSFIDHYNGISIDRLTPKTKIGNDLWYCNYSLLCKPEFFSASENFLFLLKTHTKNNYSSASDCWKYTKSFFKENAIIFSKNSTTQENITISRQN